MSLKARTYLQQAEAPARRPTRKAQQWGDQPPSAAGSVYPPAQAPPRAAQEGQDVVPRRPGRALGALRPGPR